MFITKDNIPKQDKKKRFISKYIPLFPNENSS